MNQPNEPAQSPGDSPNPLLPLLIERYENIIRKPEDESQLQFQAEELRGKGVTVEQLKAWLAWRRVSPEIRYIAEKVLMWLADQQRESQQGGTQHAKTQSGSTTDHKAIVSKFRSNKLC